MSQNNELVSSEEIRLKQFPIVRFGREGFAADKVRRFLEKVEKTIHEYELKSEKESFSHSIVVNEASGSENHEDRNKELELQLKNAQDQISILKKSNTDLKQEVESAKEEAVSASHVLKLAEQTAEDLLESVKKEAAEIKADAQIEYEKIIKRLEEERLHFAKANKWLTELEVENKLKLKEFHEKNLQELEKTFVEPVPLEYIVGTDDISDDEIKNSAGEDSLFDEPAWHDPDGDKKPSKGLPKPIPALPTPPVENAAEGEEKVFKDTDPAQEDESNLSENKDQEES